MAERTPKDVVEELFRRAAALDDEVIDELLAEDMVNHAAGPRRQGREGWKEIVATIRDAMGDDATVEHHHLIAEGDLLAHHMTIHGHHRASTMPLFDKTEATGQPVTWRYIHIWRVSSSSIGRAATISTSFVKSVRGRRRERPNRRDERVMFCVRFSDG
jgi:ketosteroid isomerase-like protein